MQYLTRAKRSPRLLKHSQSKSSSFFLARSGSTSSSLDSSFARLDVDSAPMSTQPSTASSSAASLVATPAVIDEPREVHADEARATEDEAPSDARSSYSSHKAGLEDERRRVALVERWRREGRDDLIAHSSLARSS